MDDDDVLTEKERELIDTLLSEIAPAMTRAFETPKCCLAASRALVDALRSVGITANPVPVEVLALPPNLTRRIEEEGRTPTEDAEWEAWADGQMAHGIAFGRDDLARDVNAWIGGHCAVMMLTRSGKHVLIDPSLGQINFPDDGIVLGPVYLAVPAEFAQGDEKGQTIYGGEVLLQYEAHPEHQSYLETPAYTYPDTDPFSPVTAVVMHTKRRAQEVFNAHA